ncbi:MAG: hypothetical protein WC043_02900 [Pseudobdellovibrionaceae bacterium]
MTTWLSTLGNAFVGAVSGARAKLTQTFDLSAHIDRVFDDVQGFGVDGAGCAGVDEAVMACEAEALAP